MDATPALTDPDVEPTAELIADALGPAEAAWDELTAAVTGPEFRLRIEWRYYRDGSRWLAKALRGSKNAAWLSVWVGEGGVTCYFAERHRAPLLDLDVSDALREQIAGQPMMGRMLPVPMAVRSTADVADALAVLRLKLSPAS